MHTYRLTFHDLDAAGAVLDIHLVDVEAADEAAAETAARQLVHSSTVLPIAETKLASVEEV